ncbi:MAG TPA: 3,4-dihydroxy-2-butanone-4-phosphate synthase, partial [Gammaproteobacteria bacterium]
SRAGHTEAGCDLARLAGLEAAAVIVEILNDDGTMARRPDLERFAAEHGLKIGTIADLIHYRTANEKSVERLAECSLPTAYGTFHLVAYQDVIAGDVHLAAVHGSVAGDEPVLVRVHLQNDLCDLFAPVKEDCGWPLDSALARIAASERGVLVMLRDRDDRQDLVRRIRNYQLEDKGIELPRPGAPSDLRTYGIGAQILSDLGVRKMRVLSAPKKIHALPGFDLEVVEYVNCD